MARRATPALCFRGDGAVSALYRARARMGEGDLREATGAQLAAAELRRRGQRRASLRLGAGTGAHGGWGAPAMAGGPAGPDRPERHLLLHRLGGAGDAAF